MTEVARWLHAVGERLSRRTGATLAVTAVATILLACCLVPAFFLPRKKQQPVDPTALVGH